MWKAGTLENIIISRLLLDAKGKFTRRVSSSNRSRCTFCRSSQAGLTLPRGEQLPGAVSGGQSLCPGGPPPAPAAQGVTLHPPPSHGRTPGCQTSSESAFTSCARGSNSSCSAKHPFGRLMGCQRTEPSSPKLLMINFVFSYPTYLPFSLLFWLKHMGCRFFRHHV